MTDAPRLTILVITYNSAEFIPALLDDLLKQISPAYPVVVVDNASSDQTVEVITSQYPEVRLVQNKVNLGYAKAVNLGMDLIDTPYVYLLNPDIRVPSPESIRVLIDWMDATPRCAACGPIQYMVNHNKYHLNFTTSYWSLKAFWEFLNYKMKHKWRSTQPIRVPMLNAGCIMLRRSAFLQVGKINPKYFLYGEDPDLGMKFMRFGYECWLIPASYVIHFREKSMQTLSLLQLSRVRCQALINIGDALISGWAGMMADKFRQSKKHRS